MSGNTNYYVVVTNASGCKSSIALAKVSVTTKPDTNVSVAGSVGSAVSGAGYTYQWLFNGAPIIGSTNSTYTSSQDGYYSVAITNGTCSDTSGKHFIVALGVNKSLASLKLNVFPNPSNGLFNIAGTGLESTKVKTVVTDALGRIVFEQTLETSGTDLNTQLDLSGMPQGIYQLQVIAGNQLGTYRLRLQ